MTVSSTSSRVVLGGNDSTTQWPFGFKVQQAADLVVVYTDTTGASVTLSSGQYDVTGFGQDIGGTVTYPKSGSGNPPIAHGATLTIYRNVAVTQPTSISNQGAMWPQVIEAALDRLTYIGQAVTDAISRSLVISPTDGGALGTLPAQALRRNSLLGFDGNGQPFAAQSFAPAATASSWIVGGLLTSSSPAAARTALGAAGLADSNAFTATNDFTGGAAKVPTRAAADNTTFAASTAYADRAAANAASAVVLRSYLAGLQLSTAGGSASFGIAAGMAADNGNVAPMALASAITKTTGAWAVGSGNGALDTGTIANATWYHVHLIKRIDTGAVDGLVSLSATAPTLPANYTLSRRIGALLTDGAAHWVAFVQRGDLFYWSTPVLDVSANAPGNAAVLRTLSVPPGVSVEAWLQAQVYQTSAGVNAALYVSAPDTADIAPADQAAPLFLAESMTAGAARSFGNGQTRVCTDTSSRVRTRLNNADGNTSLYIATLAWLDRRGRDS